MDVPVWRSLRSLASEQDASRLRMTGRLPDWLRGTLLRNGPGLFESAGQEARHVFDGYALLQRFGFTDQGVSYRSRFLRSRIIKEALATGRPGVRQFGTAVGRSVIDIVRTLAAPRFPDNAGVNVARIGGRWMALTESPFPVAFDPRSLATLGAFEFPEDDLWGENTTAHPHHDQATGELINLTTKFSGRERFYEFYRLRGDSPRRESICRLPVREPAYVHSFGLSERHIILAEFPLVLDPLRLLLADCSYIGAFRWKPQLGTRFRVVERATGAVVADARCDAAFAFHHVAACEEDGQLTVDVAAYDDAAIIDSFYFDRLAHSQARFPPSRLRRYRIDLRGSTITSAELFPDAMEFVGVSAPRRSWRHAYAVGSSNDERSGSFDRLLKADLASATVTAWTTEGSTFGEPVYVPEPGARSDDAGVVIALAHRDDDACDALVILDASRWCELARLELPGHVPYGFHGQFIADP